ncbi:MAG: NAD(P)H-dependent oxidoreductase subunit E [Candidatus Omnitrophota bacterium]
MKKTVREIKRTAKLDAIIDTHRGKPGALLSILEAAQESVPRKYLSKDVLARVAAKLNVALSQVYGVVTFYSFFNLKPQGRHTLTVCRGTACHTRGSKDIHAYLKTLFALDAIREEDERAPITTKDNMFTLRVLACFGQCALAPAVEIDGKVYGYVTREKLKDLIRAMSREDMKR